MRLREFLGALALAGLTAFPAAAEPFPFQTWTPGSWPALLRGPDQTEPVAARATLSLPAGEDRVPAVIILHGAAGEFSGRGRREADFLAENGVAGLVIDSYATRGLSRSDGFFDRLRRVAVFDQIADAYAGLAALRAHPRIDPNRVSVMGFSMGGISALAANNPGLVEALDPGRRGFAGHVGWYAPCIFRFDPTRATGAPVLMLIGSMDESTEPGRCRSMAHDFRRGGSPTELEILDGPHGWNQPFAPGRRGLNLAPCHFVFRDDGSAEELSTGHPANVHFSMMFAAYTCASGGGYLNGSAPEAHKTARAMTLAFLRGVGG